VRLFSQAAMVERYESLYREVTADRT